MKTLLLIAVLLVVLVLAVPACTLWQGKPPAKDLVDGRLRPCPDSPNCVCSEYREGDAFVEPFDDSGSAATAWRVLRRAVTETGGEIQQTRADYMRATYTTRFMRFVDDVEFRPAADEGVIHVRSASRVGHSDFGVNRRRVERLREVFRSRLNEAAAPQVPSPDRS